MRLAQRLRIVSWFMTRKGQETRRWAHQQGLSHDEAVERVADHGSVNAAKAALQVEHRTKARLRSMQRSGLLERDLDGDIKRPENERPAGARLASSR
jgi:hypothetical protein